VPRPVETRRAAPFLSSSFGSPRASITCDCLTTPEEHAEPEETAKPALSNAIIKASASVFSKKNEVICGARFSREPVN